MENFKFILFSIFIIVILGLGVFWAFKTIETGSVHVDNQKYKELESKNQELEKEINTLKREISFFENEKIEQESKATEEIIKEEIPTKDVVVTPPTVTKPVVLKYQTLINELQKMVNNKVVLKIKSQGPSVGSVQKFLNIYNNTSNKIDNDYGVTTSNLVKTFQKAVGLTANGEAGPSTFIKMINWLKTK